jgi:hypothetical protein
MCVLCPAQHTPPSLGVSPLESHHLTLAAHCVFLLIDPTSLPFITDLLGMDSCDFFFFGAHNRRQLSATFRLSTDKKKKDIHVGIAVIYSKSGPSTQKELARSQQKTRGK